ncbi:MAG: hypothetical protein KKA64_01910 [Nanoarchaeota archaeon]|nr:hypothetical protein [Nanoarchaeota archaeon]
MENKSFFKSTPVVAFFAALALFGGFFFLNKGFTGNIIIDYTTKSKFEFLAVIGLLLIACSVVLAFYTMKKK